MDRMQYFIVDEKSLGKSFLVTRITSALITICVDRMQYFSVDKKSLGIKHLLPGNISTIRKLVAEHVPDNKLFVQTGTQQLKLWCWDLSRQQ